MLVKQSNNQKLSFILHKQGNYRRYTVDFLGYSKKSLDFSYTERSVKEYIFDGDFAISGSNNHGIFGVVNNNQFYWEEFSKWAKVFANNSPFWGRKKFSEQFEMFLDNKPVNNFNGDVNLWFTIGEYWHWFCEDIPLIEQLRTNDFPIITNKLKEWQKESLSFFPDVVNRLIEVETPSIIKADRFHTFTFPAISYRGKTSSWVPEFLKKSFPPSQNFIPSELIYISRGDAVARSVENENDVKNFLVSKGFRCYENFSKLSVQEKIDAFNKARIVVAPTGSNLTHCHSMQPGTIVLDFNHEFELEAECGWNSLGTGVGVKWYSFPASTGSIGPRSKNGKKQKNNNLLVDIDVLSKALTHVIG